MAINNFSEQRSDLGKLYENFIAIELLKKDFELKYWRTKSNAEVDFIIEKNGEMIPIEVKKYLSKTIIGK